MARSIILLLVILATHASQAQRTIGDTLLVFGTIMDLGSEEPIPSFQVTAVDVADSTHVLKAEVNNNGTYQIAITEERSYIITYSARGYVSKRVLVEVAGPSPEEWKGGYGMNIDINLPQQGSKHTDELYKAPVAIARYDPKAGNFAWDDAYNRAMREKVKRATR